MTIPGSQSTGGDESIEEDLAPLIHEDLQASSSAYVEGECEGPQKYVLQRVSHYKISFRLQLRSTILM